MAGKETRTTGLDLRFGVGIRARTSVPGSRFGVGIGARTTAPSIASPAPGARCAGLSAVDELVHYRHDLAAATVIESAVRAEGGFPTQGGGTRVIALSTDALRTVRGRA